MRHVFERGHFDAAVDVLAERDGHTRGCVVELGGFENGTQADNFAARVRHFNANGGFAGQAFDQNRFGLQAEAKIFHERGDAAVFHARFRGRG